MRKIFLEKAFHSFKRPIANTLDIPIFLNSGSFLHPAEYYLKLKYGRDFYVTATHFDEPPPLEYL